MSDDLTQEERAEIEACIGIGSDELGAPPSDTLVSACRKLGLEPVNWHGRPILPPQEGA